MGGFDATDIGAPPMKLRRRSAVRRGDLEILNRDVLLSARCTMCAWWDAGDDIIESIGMHAVTSRHVVEVHESAQWLVAKKKPTTIRRRRP